MLNRCFSTSTALHRAPIAVVSDGDFFHESDVFLVGPSTAAAFCRPIHRLDIDAESEPSAAALIGKDLNRLPRIRLTMKFRLFQLPQLASQALFRLLQVGFKRVFLPPVESSGIDDNKPKRSSSIWRSIN